MSHAAELSATHYNEAQARADEHLGRELKLQAGRGINATRQYAHDIAENKAFLDDCAGSLDGLGVLAELLYLSQKDTILTGIFLHRLGRELIRDRALQEEIESDGLYQPIETDLTISKAIHAVEAALSEIKNRSK